MVSAAQRKARARFAYIMKHGGFRKKESIIRHRSTTTSMPRRRLGRVRTVYRRARGGFRRRGGVHGITSGIKPYALGIGGGAVGQALANQFMPSMAPIGKYGGAFVFGRTKGIIGQVVFDLITGQGLPMLGNLFGGGQSSGGSDTL